ncbi:hypothetical protein AYI68_g202 [Smittium mucronatum]|uniref:Uncharacterized protein n=1 Tax=Smittium mucronatum TaxID=133383 RepID=A0A1R0H943_9FUNG|nr:hypothetical protein AYI68_g202 [Smittium mucronatum]
MDCNLKNEALDTSTDPNHTRLEPITGLIPEKIHTSRSHIGHNYSNSKDDLSKESYVELDQKNFSLYSQMEESLERFSEAISNCKENNIDFSIRNFQNIYTEILDCHISCKLVSRSAFDKIKSLTSEKNNWDSEKKNWEIAKQEWEKISKQEIERKSLKSDRDKRFNAIKDLEFKELVKSEAQWKARAERSESDIINLKETLEDIVETNRKLKEQLKSIKSDPSFNPKPINIESHIEQDQNMYLIGKLFNIQY